MHNEMACDLAFTVGSPAIKNQRAMTAQIITPAANRNPYALNGNCCPRECSQASITADQSQEICKLAPPAQIQTTPDS
jgi:hypothetical protein